MEYFGNILYDEKLKDKSNTFAIYGAGKFGEKIYEYMDLNGGKDQIKYFCDRNPDFKGTNCCGLPVIAPEDVIKDQDIHILFGGIYAYEILEYLVEHHVKNMHFLYF